MLEYLRQYQDVQIDARGLLRKTWLFEFRIHRQPSTVTINDDRFISAGILNRESKSGAAVVEDDRHVAITDSFPDGDPTHSYEGL
jgi:hypothetical protein